MAERPEISVVLITRNEAARIRACLDSVRWAEEIVVVDQHSGDSAHARRVHSSLPLNPRGRIVVPSVAFALDRPER